jgi:transposase
VRECSIQPWVFHGRENFLPLLLQGEEKIRSNQEAHAKLERIFAVNQPLYTAFLLKEELRALWTCSSRTQAEMYLGNWLKKAWASGVAQVVKFACTVASHRTVILNYFDHPYSVFHCIN